MRIPIDDEVKKERCRIVLDALKDGLTFKQAAALVGRHSQTVSEWMRGYEPYLDWRRSKDVKPVDGYLPQVKETFPTGYITMGQVHLFKSIVSVGEDLYYDYADDGGLPIAGTLVKKYDFIGLLRVGDWLTGVPWTWLTIMNRKRIHA